MSRWLLPLTIGVVVVLVAVAVFWSRSVRPRPTAVRTTFAVPASIPSDCSRPVDDDLARFLRTVPDHSTVQFRPGGCYGQNDSLWVIDRHDLTIEGNGATFKIVTTALDTTLFRSNWRVRGGSGITFRDLSVVGACGPDQCGNGQPPPPMDGYGQHGFNLESTARPTLDRVHVSDVLSDGVEAQGTLDPATGWKGPATSDLVIRNSTIERVGRQVIGLTDVDGALIEDNAIANGPETGIDVEVDQPGFLARRLQILRNAFDNIHAEVIANGGLGSEPLVGDFTIADNTMTSPTAACAGSIYLRAPGPSTPALYRSRYTITGNHFRLVGWFIQAERITNLTVADNVVDYQQVGCQEKAFAELMDSHTVTVRDNVVRGYQATVWADPATTGVTEG